MGVGRECLTEQTTTGGGEATLTAEGGDRVVTTAEESTGRTTSTLDRSRVSTREASRAGEATSLAVTGGEPSRKGRRAGGETPSTGQAEAGEEGAPLPAGTTDPMI